MFSTGQAESIFHVLVHGVCTPDMRKHARAAEAQPCVCTPLCPCSCTSGRLKVGLQQALLSVQFLVADLLIQVQNDA